MIKGINLLINCIVACLIFCNNAQAASATYWDVSGDHNWMTLANWNGDPIPTSTTDAFMAATANINSGQNAVCASLYLGHGNALGVVNVNTGGTLSPSNWATVADWGGTATLNVSGQIISSYPLQIGAATSTGGSGGTPSNGTCNLYGGLIQVSLLNIGTSGGVGTLNVYGGTFQITGTSIGWGSASTSKINLIGGVLIFNGDATATVNWGLNYGMIVGHNGSSVVHWDYNVTNPGQTTVWTDRITCQNGYYLPGDVNKDCSVDMADLAMLVQSWLKCNNYNQAGCTVSYSR